jgi:hypothetical protein
MRLMESSLTDKEEVGEKPHSNGYSRRTMSHMNEDDEKLQTSVIEKEDRKIVLIIGGVEIFLPSGQGKASTSVAQVIAR